jgi:hypothetical protein
VQQVGLATQRALGSAYGVQSLVRAKLLVLESHWPVARPTSRGPYQSRSGFRLVHVPVCGILHLEKNRAALGMLSTTACPLTNSACDCTGDL